MSGFLCFLLILVFGHSLGHPSIVKDSKKFPPQYASYFYFPEDQVQEAKNDLTPQLAVYTSDENLKPEIDNRRISKFAQELDEFHKRLTKTVLAHNPGENLIYSPISISILLMMIAFGTRGATLNEIFKQTGLEFNPQTLLGFYEIIDLMKNVDGIELELANVIFASEDIELVPDYQREINIYLKSDIKSMDFSDPTLAAKQINDWCKKQTKNQITEIVTPNDLVDIVLVLANAIYFKGNWLKPFEVADTEQNVPFYVRKDVIVPVSMMFMADEFNYGKIKELDTFFIELPYQHGKDDKDFFSMYLLVPTKKDGLDLVERNLHLIDFKRLNFFEESAHLHLPKFNIESTLDVRPILEKMGMKQMFSGKADFRGMVDDRQVSLDYVVQKASLKVNEEGTVAAAVSSGGFEDRILPAQIVADRPFLCAIVLKSIGLPIFYARVVDPTKQG